MLQLTSTITENATIEIGLRDIEVPKPGADEVLIEQIKETLLSSFLLA